MIEELFQLHTVLGSIVICGDDDEALLLHKQLVQRDHDPVVVTMGDVEDDRGLYRQKLRAFRKMLVLSYSAWKMIASDIEVYILPHHNMVVYGGLEQGHIQHIERWLTNSSIRGFCMPTGAQPIRCLIGDA